MRPLQEIEDAITQKIADVGNEELYAIWLEYLDAKKMGLERFVSGMEKKDSVVIGAVIGCLVGHLFAKDENAAK